MMDPEEHQAAVNRRATLQSKLAMVEALQKNNPSNVQYAFEKNEILKELSSLETKIGFHFQEQDNMNPRAQI